MRRRRRMVSDSELVNRLREFLSTSDLNTTTTASVRRQLEQDFGIDLRDKKAFIREQVDLYLENQQHNEDEQVEDTETEDEEAKTARSGGSRNRGLVVNLCIRLNCNQFRICYPTYASNSC